jgi:hypothetical protein
MLVQGIFVRHRVVQSAKARRFLLIQMTMNADGALQDKKHLG